MIDKSIRKQLLVWLLIPLCSLCLISSVFAYFSAVAVANQSHDFILLNAADSLATRLRWHEDKVAIDMPLAAQAILRHNDVDKIYYQVLDANLKRISGDAVIPGPVRRPELKVVFRDADFKGQPIRVARVRFTDPTNPDNFVLVQVAETLNGRRMLVEQILFNIIVPEVLLIVLAGAVVWFGVGRALEPLRTLQRALANRSQYDLTPVALENAPVELRPLLVTINDLLVRLRNELESQKRFVANAAHQLRTPLAGLATYTGFAKRLAKDGEMFKVVDQIESGTDRMVHLVNRLLALAKAEPSVQVRSQYTSHDLNFVASDATTELVHQALKKNVDLSFEASEKPALVYGDYANLRELTINLVENAVLYTQDGGRVNVRVSNGNGVLLTVQDNGPGIPKEDKEHVFERFYRVLGSEAPGSGLGLAIVKEIVTAHDATITIDDPPSGNGTVVSVHFGG
jgi:two-component system, OmpR family, sensor histidine kinase TctE